MFSHPFTLLFQNLACTVRGEYLILRPEPGPAEKARARRLLGAPQLYEGQRADHLTIPLKVRERGPNRGFFNVHLTWLDDTHRTVALVHPDDLMGLGERCVVEIIGWMQERVRQIDLEALAKDGFYAVVPGEKYLEAVREFIDAPPRAYRLRPREFEDRILEHMEIMSLDGIEQRLSDEVLRRVPLPLVRVVDDQVERQKVGFFAKGLLGGPPGWYSLPDDDELSIFLDRTFQGVLQPGFFKVMRIIARELQIDLNLEPFSTARPRHSEVAG